MKLLGAPLSRTELYDLLGLTPEATDPDIRKAYKKKAKQLHPDANGGVESEEFVKMKKAYDILINPETRKMYDETGIIDGEHESKLMNAALGGLQHCFNILVEEVGPDEMIYVDVIGSMKLNIKTNLDVHKKNQAGAAKAIAKIEKAKETTLKRLKIKKDAPNIFIMALDKAAQPHRDVMFKSDQAVLLCETMLKMLENYEYTFDEKPLDINATSMASMLSTWNTRG